MDPHAANHEDHGHAEPAPVDFKMDYSKWSNNNIIPAIIFVAFVLGVSTIFMH